jgi:hypothetical protein
MRSQSFVASGGRGQSSTKWVAGLTAGAAAAGLGARQAAADVVGPITVNQVINSGHGDYTVDFHSDSNGEVGIHYDVNAGLSAKRIGSTGNPQYLVGSVPGQVKALSLGDTISPTDPAFSPLNTSGGPNPLLNDGAGHGEFTAAAGEKYIGVRLSDGTVGWVGFRVTNDSSVGNLSGTVIDFAYESDPSKNIAAGLVPEPSSLALLAVGATALAAYRRRARV